MDAVFTSQSIVQRTSKYKSKVVAPRNPKLIKNVQNETKKLKPSQFLFDMTLDTEKKLASQHTMKIPKQIKLLDISENTHQKSSQVNIDEPMFQPFPSEIFFQKYEPFKTYEVPLVLRNCDKVPRLIKITHKESPYFQVVSPQNCAHKVGPGLPTTYKVLFTPDNPRDYVHELICTTEREEFAIPIQAIGARAVLDFPDDVVFAVGAVKHHQSRTLLVRNIGNRDAKFLLVVDKPFSVSPDNGELAVGASMQITVGYHSVVVGEHKGEMVLHYDTGEDLYIALRGTSQDVAVRLEKSVVQLEATFISLANQTAVIISNRSDVVAHFRWTRFATVDEESQQKLALRDSLSLAESIEKSRFHEEPADDPTIIDKTSMITQTYRNKRRIIDDDRMLFNDDIVKIEPLEGDVWPNSTSEISIMFRPEAAREYSRTAFCDVTGRESRLPLQIRGTGLGPQVVLSFERLDVGNVFVFSKHAFEIVLANVGAIDAIFALVPPTSALGRLFRFDPSEGIVMPDAHQAICVSFSSRNVGEFVEDFFFQIDGAPENIKLTLCGTVVAPTLHFDIPKLEFGTVSYGFETSRKCILSNSSLVPVAYHLHMADDGHVPSMRSRGLWSADGPITTTAATSASEAAMPKEFCIDPYVGLLAPQSHVEINVELCSNTVRKYNTELCVDVEAVQDNLLLLPVVARCIVPRISVLTPLLNLGRCFLSYPYQIVVELNNDSDLPAKYELLPCSATRENESIVYSSPQPVGILEPQSVLQVPLTVIVGDLEELETTVQFSIIGNHDVTLPVHITCYGEGPVVHVMPQALNWGTINVLIDSPKILRLSNESLIPAVYTTKTMRTNSVWRIDPPAGTVEPECSLDLVVTACVDDCLSFADKLLIEFEQGPVRSIPLSAIGRGSTIVSEPLMTSVLDLGPQFSRNVYRRTFKLTNRGRRHQTITWSTDGFPLVQRWTSKKKLPTLQSSNGKNINYRDHPTESETPRPIFSFMPQRLELNPGESSDIVLEGNSDIVQTVKEKLLCHASIGRSGGKELIKKVQIVCEFVDPLLDFSTDSISFTVHKNPDDILEVQSASLEMTNISSLPLNARLSVQQPFCLNLYENDHGFQAYDYVMHFDVGEMRVITILFDPAYRDDYHSRHVDGLLTVSYIEHPHQDSIKLRGEVFFPNLRFEKMVVDFGCVLNDTEVTRYLNITNNSPLEVSYRWSFLLDDKPVAIFREPPLRQSDVHNSSMQLDEVDAADEIAQLEVQLLDVAMESPRNQSDENEDKVFVSRSENEFDDEKMDEEKLDVRSSSAMEILQVSVPMATVSSSQSAPAVNASLAAMLQKDSIERILPGVEEIFDILPIYGTLRPSEAEQITLTFYGHANIVSEARATCEVEGGPTYEILLKGEASLVDYKLDIREINYSKILFDQIAVSNITLFNTGHVGFSFVGIGMDPLLSDSPKLGVPIMIPHSGYINPMSEQVLIIKYLSLGPQKFNASFQIQVAHFEPETIHLCGEGVFPHIALNLPRLASVRPENDDDYHRLMAAAKENLTNERLKYSDSCPVSVMSELKEADNRSPSVNESPELDMEIQMEMERLLVLEFVNNHLVEGDSEPDILVIDEHLAQSRIMDKSSNKKARKQRAILPDYVLDFGHIVLGSVSTKTVTVTNIGWFPVSFNIDRTSRYQSGFSIELPRVVQLPGDPDHETVDFVVTFDPRGANLATGVVEVFVPINVVGGPMVRICLRADVTVPDMQISSDVIEFGEVKCGECCIGNVQIYNHQAVQCEWTALPIEDNKKQVDKHVPMHLRRKRQEKQSPGSFEVIPSSGLLQPSQRQNIQIKFMPTEQKFYENRVMIKLSQSRHRINLMCRGQGLEPHIEFDRPLIEFGPNLPHGPADEKEVIIRNPCKFPVEIYNLEFDQHYLEEEQILRMMKGYDEFNMILLPPRFPGEKLPQELLDYAEEVKIESDSASQKQEDLKTDQSNRDETADQVRDNKDVKDVKPVQGSEEPIGGEDKSSEKKTLPLTSVGDLEVTPVSAAIARHLGIDLTPEGIVSRSRRGIVILVHGAPLSGKTMTASSLGHRYDIPVLTIDDIIIASLSSGSTAGTQARELCAEAARRLADESRAPDDVSLPLRGLPGVTFNTEGLSSQAASQGLPSNRKISTETKGTKQHGTGSSKTGGNAPGHNGEGNNQVFTSGSPVPLTPAKVQRFSLGTAADSDESFVNALLPEHLVVAILAERLLKEDCHKGVVFDGIESMFTESCMSSAIALLKAVNNRKYIYSISLKLDYNYVKEKEKRLQEEKERAERDKEELEKQRLEEMSEDEYDALTDEKKAEVDKQRLMLKKERLKRERAERLERDRREEEKRREEELRKQEEDMKRKKRRGGAAAAQLDKNVAKKPTSQNKTAADPNPKDKLPPGSKPFEVKKPHESGEGSKIGENKQEVAVDSGELASEDKKKKEKIGKEVSSDSKTKLVDLATDESLKEKDAKSEAELILMERFGLFENSFKQVSELFDWWERSTGAMNPGAPSIEAQEAAEESHNSGKKQKQERNRERHDAKSRNKDAQLPSENADDQCNPAPTEEEKQEKRLQEGIGIPHIVINWVESDQPLSELVASSGKLPPAEEVLDCLGLGPKGPPIPPLATFSVVSFPIKRQPPVSASSSHFSITSLTQEDTSQEDKSTEQEQLDEAKLAEVKLAEERSRDGAVGSKTNSNSSRRGPSRQQNESKPKEARRGRNSIHRASIVNASPPSGLGTQASEQTGGTSGLVHPQSKVSKMYRWVIPAESEITLKLSFNSDNCGQFDHTLNFEIVSTRRRYQLFCRGVCTFPNISNDPRVVFPHRKKNLKPDEIVHKKYILATNVFEFGPLLAGKSRDKHKEGRFPENMEKLIILNTSLLESEVSFSFLGDNKGESSLPNPPSTQKADTKEESYLLDPPSMTLKPLEQQELTLWAYPKTDGVFSASLVCCVKENPEPVVFKLHCYGVRPGIELDKKALHFDKVLLHRKDTKTLCLKNKTMLPVAWRLTGLENLGEDFSVSQETGVVPAKSEFVLSVFFRALKAAVINKKTIRIEVSDVDNIMGLLQSEVITIHAEAYDVALDVSFPKGTEGGIDFNAVRVSDEAKQTCTVKNKGKYDISYSFSFEPTPDCPREICNLFTIAPQQGVLSSSDRAVTVQITFRSDREVAIKEQPILQCKVIEPSIGDGGEIVACIPVKISVKSLFIRYNINPMNDINFGALVLNSKKNRTFTIENKGEKFDFKYTIARVLREDNRTSDSKIRRGGENTVGQTKLVVGMFTVYPSFGSVQPGNQQTVNVDCFAESQGLCEEDLVIDIIGREPKDNPGGIPYRLSVEACVPSINLDDIGSIFEEHRICKNMSVDSLRFAIEGSSEMSSTHADQLCGGIYGEEDRKFVFFDALVGVKSRARFKISNPKKVPCDVSFSIKPLVATKAAAKQPSQEVFEVSPSRVQIAPHRYVYAIVTFCPPAMQQYGAIFDASIDVTPANQPKGRSLTFELSGEGNLPHIAVARPTLRNKRGQPLLLFRRTLVGHYHTMPVVILNDGTLTCKVDVSVNDTDEAFSIQAVGKGSQTVRNNGGRSKSAILDVGESAQFEVTYRASVVQRSEGHVRLTVVDNQYEDITVQLVAEGYSDDIVIECASSIAEVDYLEDGSLAEDDAPATKPNVLKLGDCNINEPRTVAFTMSNRSEHSFRFSWPEEPNLKFSPRIGHLLAGSSKDVSVTFKVDRPNRITEKDVKCRVARITFDRPLDEVADWDDRLKTVKWIAASQTASDGTQAAPTVGPLRKKVIETEPEPTFAEFPETVRTVSLLVTANADYCKYKLKETKEKESLRFRDTLMFQTRVYQFELSNVGAVAIEYSWQVVMDNFAAVHSLIAGTQTASAVRLSSAAESPRPVTAGPLIIRSDAETSLRPQIVAKTGDIGIEEASASPRSSGSGPPYIPFIIEPSSGVLPPGKSAVVAIKFSPLDVNEYEGRLICSIPNLEPGTHGPVVGVRGRSLLPYCHFELEDSDYIRAGRRNPDLPGPRGSSAVDPNTRVIEFQSVGVGVIQSVQFDVVNPTNQNYTFAWTCEDVADAKRPANFVCHASNGNILSGKKFQMHFEFRSSSIGCVESFWRFEIFEQNVSVPFLLVGRTHDPNISFDRSHVNFRSILIGHEASSVVHLVNGENDPLNFSFDDASCQAAGYAVRVVLDPVHGTVPAKSKLPVTIKFTPTWEKEVNFNITCTVKRKPVPLTLNVKAEGFSMNCLATCEDPFGERSELSSTTRNLINFGRVEVKDKAVRTITLINLGQYLFNYNWEIRHQQSYGETGAVLSSGNEDDGVINLSPMFGSIAQGEKAACLLTFTPPIPLSLKNCELVLKVSLGPTYIVQLNGSGVIPGLQFSNTSHSFGTCFVYRPEMPVHSHVLKLTNTDNKDISVNCLYQSTAWLTHNFEACVISPQQTVDATFSFYPREPTRYRDWVTFEINGLSRQVVEFTGLGTELKIEVAEARHKIVQFGAMRIGHTVKKIVPIVNNSTAPMTFRVALNPTSSALQEAGVVRLSPTEPITLQQKGGMAKVEVVLSPKSRIAQFSEEVRLECMGFFHTLFVVTGSCHGLEIALDAEAIPFGAVVQNSSSSRQVIMNNTGDIGARFKWDVSRMGADFSLSPLEGYVSAGMDVPFDIVFHPKEINNDIRCENIKCQVEGMSKPLGLTLTGSCVGVQPVRDVYHFTTHVRQKETKSLQVPNNSTSMIYNLRPVIDGVEYWSGPELLVVPPLSTKYYELTYYPMNMTTEGKKHTGSVFFPLPDGQGLMYHVSGTAEPPKPNGKISRDVTCRITHVEILSVLNWLKKAQRFRMKLECIKPDKLDPSTTVKGLDYIDVPGTSARDYKLTFHSHKECQPLMKVTFTNEQTGEYQFFEIQFRALRPGVLATIQLSTIARQRKQHTVTLENPLATSVTFLANCTAPDIQMPSQLVVHPNSEGTFNLEYFPLKAGAAQGKLEFTSNDLGFYQYNVNLLALSAGPEKALNFQTCLGSSQTLVAKFLNYSKHKTDYSCKLDHADYHVDKSVTATPATSSGSEVAIEVLFEPSGVGETRATLLVSSSAGGDYSFPLVGVCLLPKPQGPFIIKTGSNVSIPFRNVFSQTTTFQFAIDNPVFRVAKATETIRSRKEHRVVVSFDGVDAATLKAPVAGRLVISCVRATGGPVASAELATPPNTQWVFYLKGAAA